MISFRLPLILMLAFAFAACASLDARDRLAQAETAYAAVVVTAIDLRRTGIMDDETAQRLTPAFVEANELLERAHQAIVDGNYELADEHRRAAEALIIVITSRMSRDE